LTKRDCTVDTAEKHISALEMEGNSIWAKHMVLGHRRDALELNQIDPQRFIEPPGATAFVRLGVATHAQIVVQQLECARHPICGQLQNPKAGRPLEVEPPLV
jgi:hypothetical protein